jgi:hypothetical protein
MTRISERIDFVRMITVLFLLYPLNTSYATQDKKPEMKLKELVQQLDAANPWPVERVEAALGVKLTLARSNDEFTVHTAETIDYAEGLTVEKVRLRLNNKDTHEMIRLIVSLSDDASCFTLNRIKRTWPDTQLAPFPGPRGDSWDEETGYWTERPWGHIDFGFKERRPKCLSSITFIPKKWE